MKSRGAEEEGRATESKKKEVKELSNERGFFEKFDWFRAIIPKRN